MANKLTNNLIEKMVLDTLNESNDINEILGAIKGFFGDRSPTQTPSRKGISGGSYKLPAGYGAVSDKEEVLNFIVATRNIPNNIKEKMIDLVMAAPSAKKAATKKSTPKLVNPDVPVAPEGPAPINKDVEDLIPTVKTAPAATISPTVKQGFKTPVAPTTKTGEIPSDLPEPEKVASKVPTSKGIGMGSFPSRTAVQAKRFQRAASQVDADIRAAAAERRRREQGLAMNEQIESIISEVLEEMAKKGKKEPKKETKQQPKKTGKK